MSASPAKADLGRLLDYTVWANHRILRAVATLAVDDFRKDLGSSHGGVRGTLVHVMGAEWLWLERWKGVSPAWPFDEAQFADVMAIRERWRAIEEHRAAWLAGLSEPGVTAAVAYQTLTAGAGEAPLWQLVQHLANHSSYHRGQVITLVRQLGGKPVSTDMLAWDRDRAAKA